MSIYTKKMMKKLGVSNPVMDNAKNKLTVWAYDEDVLGDKLLVYVAIKGFESYSSFVVENDFSVYKMPKFELYVPREAFTLTKK